MDLVINDLKKTYGNLPVYENFNLSIHENKITCILGPSGCGKTTLLKLISGITSMDSGELQGFGDKSISYLFQENRLLPWKTLADNIAFVLKPHFPKEEVQKKVATYLDLVQLRDFKDYYPHEVSGGMNQRVAIARAFAYPSEILLMDEPFKGLDGKLKQELLEVFVQLWSKDRRTVLYITHDVDEAIMLGDDIYVFSGTPTKVRKNLSISCCKKERLKKKCRLSRYRKELCSEIFG